MENKIESRIDIINFLSERFNYKNYRLLKISSKKNIFSKIKTIFTRIGMWI